MGRSLSLIILAIGVAMILIQLYKFFVSINSSSSKRRKDVEELKLKIADKVKQLVPMTSTELELLSINQSEVSLSRGINSEKTGSFTSIYQEPLLAYGYKRYNYLEDTSILLVSTASDDYIYMSEGPSTQVYLNNNKLGVIDAEGNLFDPVSKKQLARIEADQILSSHPVKIGEREVGEVVNLRQNESPNPRVYQFLEPMNEREEHIFKALTFLSLIEESV
ncbi:MAG: hypothetical protein P1U56_16535 [Saprospiraceae bacterium]|nr:hypothetical protein [Saprospiraceae bacterium]